MLLEDYARLYTFRAASLTMARMISPRLGWRVRDADNDTRALFSPLVLSRTEPRGAGSPASRLYPEGVR